MYLDVRVSVCNNSVQANLVEVGGLELQHLVDSRPVDLVCSVPNLLRSTVGTAEASADELLAVLVEKVVGGLVCTRGDLDELGKTVSDLCLGQGTKEAEVKEGVHGSVVGTKTVLVITVVDGDLDRDGSIDQTDDSGGDTDVVGVSAVGSAGETTSRLVLFVQEGVDRLGLMGQSALKLSLAVVCFTQRHQ